MRDEEKFFEQIKEVLQNHEEPYVLGSWERFEKRKQRKNTNQKNLLFLAAAILLLGFVSLFAWINQGTEPEQQIVQEHSAEQPETTELSPDSSAHPESVSTGKPEQNLPPENESVAAIAEPQSTPLHSQAKAENTVAEHAGTGRSLNPDIATIAHVSLPAGRFFSEPSEFISAAGTPFFPDTENRQEETPSSHVTDYHPTDTITRRDLQLSGSQAKPKPLVLSVAYASMMNIHNSQTDLSSGGGIYAGWNFAQKFTLSTGLAIAQNNLRYTNEPGNFLASTFTPKADEAGIEAAVMSGENLSSVQVNFLNLEIPLDLRYHISEKFSISAGISSVTYLKEEYDYNFEYGHRMQSFTNASDNGRKAEEDKLITFRTTQTQTEPALDEVNWGAFYTFSVGYHHQIFHRYRASFEPFVKIPAGQITSRGMSYTTGGLQLRLSF